jgi:signal transduction histidine kinase
MTANNDRPHPRRAERRARREAEHLAKRERDRAALLAQIERLAGDEEIHDHFAEEREEGRARGAAIALAVLTVVQIAVVSSLSWYPSIATQLHLQLHPGFWPYVVAVLCFLPLMLCRQNPVLMWVLATAFAGLYLAMPWPPSIVILAPMSALYTLAERYGGRRAIPLGIVFGAIVLGVSALTVSVNYIVAQLVAILALSALAAVAGHGAQQRRELFDEVRRKRQEQNLRRVEEERLRIARDVHDIMAHSLTLMTLQADAGATNATDPAKAAAAFTVIGDTGRATLRDLRSMLAVLSGGQESQREPVAELGQLDALVASVRETGLDVALDVAGDVASVPSAVSVSAYRIAQEALTNVVRHANASHADVVLRVGPEVLSLRVADNGAGSPTPAADGAGRGLAGMAERVEVLGGSMSAGPSANGGFEVHAVIPLTRGKTCRSE